MSKDETLVTRITSVQNLRAPEDSCLVCIYGPLLGQKRSLSELEILSIGRGEQNQVVLDIDNVSRRHCEISAIESQYFIRDLGSTNGTYVNGREIKDDQQLQNGDHIKVGGAIFKYLAGGNIESLYHEEIYRMTIKDGLTQVYNKRYFLEALSREMARCSRFDRPLHLIMMDVDHFKNLNDTHGHIAGDTVLKELASLVDSNVRIEETFARYGGEEFGLIIPEVESDKVMFRAEKIRKQVEGRRFLFENETLNVTISMGVAAMTPEFVDSEAFIKVADERLYEAKRSGRNRVVL